jgi:rhodanese-related sulfurtransferase
MKNSKTTFGLLLGAILLLISYAETEDKNYSVAHASIFQDVDEMVSLAKDNIEEVSVQDFRKIFNAEEYFLIDLRTQSEHDGGYIPGSINITRGLLEFQIAKESVWTKAGMYVPGKDELIIVYCRSGGRAALAAETLEHMGYTNVKSIEGGWLKWKNTYPELYEEKAPSGGETHKAEEGGC